MDLNTKNSSVVIISDIHGWYDLEIKDASQLIRLDARTLAGIDRWENVHDQFINGGIDKAVAALLAYEASIVIGLSIGGTIAWKAALRGWRYQRLHLLSATRLRYEEVKPSGDIQLIYGNDDPFRPKNDWFSKMDLNFQLLPGETHDFYKNSDLDLLCE